VALRAILDSRPSRRPSLCHEDQAAIRPSNPLRSSSRRQGSGWPVRLPTRNSEEAIFLHAAAEIGVSPRECIIIEDSASGVIAGREAGSTVIGLLAAGHIRDGHGARLKDAGAHYLAADYVEVERIVRDLLSG
jgi:hypothetical protein